MGSFKGTLNFQVVRKINYLKAKRNTSIHTWGMSYFVKRVCPSLTSFYCNYLLLVIRMAVTFKTIMRFTYFLQTNRVFRLDCFLWPSSDSASNASSYALLSQINFCRLFRTSHISDDWCKIMFHRWLIIFQHRYADDWLGLHFTTHLERHYHVFWLLFVLAQVYSHYLGNNGTHHLYLAISITRYYFTVGDNQFSILLVNPWHKIYIIWLMPWEVSNR